MGKPGIKKVIPDKAVPAGQYTLDMLDKMNEDASYGADFRARVLANVVSYEQNVKSVVSKVQLGEADAGVVYTTDVTPAASEQVGSLAVSDAFNQVATYPIAPLAMSRNADAAARFAAYVLSAKGKVVLAKHGSTVA